MVEDVEADVKLLEAAMRHFGSPAVLHAEFDADSALSYLRSGGETDVILLDLKLPGMSGLELLERLKWSDSLKHIPVVVLSGSQDQSDVTESYRLHAAAFLRKPEDLDGYAELVRAFSNFWLKVALMP